MTPSEYLLDQFDRRMRQRRNDEWCPTHSVRDMIEALNYRCTCDDDAWGDCIIERGVGARYSSYRQDYRPGRVMTEAELHTWVHKTTRPAAHDINYGDWYDPEAKTRRDDDVQPTGYTGTLTLADGTTRDVRLLTDGTIRDITGLINGTIRVTFTIP